MLHKYSTPPNNHVIHSWEVTSLIERDALVVIASDRGRICWVHTESDDTFYVLVEHDPMSWSNPLQGPPGDTGSSGLSAYQIAVLNGFVGDEAAWIASLEGTPGVGIPAGGTVGQVYTKLSPTDFDADWVDPPSPGGNAIDVAYDNTASGLTAVNAQAAIDEIVATVGDIQTILEGI